MPYAKVGQPAGEDFQRPSLERSISGAEFLRWCWLKTELAVFARSHGLSTTGGKEQLSEALSAATVVPEGQRWRQILRAWFTRTWFAEHPDGTRNELQKAWQLHRSLPVDQRP
ncbi:SAP domain-containing protein [Arthrobacter sp. TMP15]